MMPMSPYLSSVVICIYEMFETSMSTENEIVNSSPRPTLALVSCSLKIVLLFLSKALMYTMGSVEI